MRRKTCHRCQSSFSLFRHSLSPPFNDIFSHWIYSCICSAFWLFFFHSFIRCQKNICRLFKEFAQCALKLMMTFFFGWSTLIFDLKTWQKQGAKSLIYRLTLNFQQLGVFFPFNHGHSTFIECRLCGFVSFIDEGERT